MGGRGTAAVIRALVDPGTLAPNTVISLSDGEAHHLRVRRVRPGARLQVTDGEGHEGEGVLEDGGRIHVASVHTATRSSPLVLVVGAGDRDRFAWVVEKATEFGVTDVVPITTERTTSVGDRVEGRHVEKLQRRAFEALKQCGGAWAPVVHLPCTLPELVARHATGARWLADAEGTAPPAHEARGPLAAIVGPEGGLTSAERETLLAARWTPVRLARQTLRFETAAVAVMAIAALAREAGDDNE